MGFNNLLAAVDRASLATFGDSVTYAPSVGSPVNVNGIFDLNYVHVDVGNPGLSSVAPAVFLLTVDLPSNPVTDNATVTVDAVQYQIREAKPDGKGGVTLLLHKV